MELLLNPVSYYRAGKYLLVDLWRDICDKRIASYWLAQNGMLNSVLIVSAYLIFSNYIGPRLMRDRPAFSLKPVLVGYNLSMALANVYFFGLSVVVLKFGVAIFNFNVPDAEDRSEWAMYTIESGYMYLISKYLDFFDSLFFVLRKKFSHLNFLHLYHHSSVAGLGTVVFLLYPTATPLGIFTLLNSLIHVVMYTYYGLSALGPWIQPYLWWKKYITQIQIVQFVIYIIYLVAFASLQKGYSPFLLSLGWTQAPLFLYLFVRFYIRTYNRTERKSNAASATATAASAISVSAKKHQPQRPIEYEKEINNNNAKLQNQRKNSSEKKLL